MRERERERERDMTSHPTPYALRLTPYTLRSTLYTLHVQVWGLRVGSWGNERGNYGMGSGGLRVWGFRSGVSDAGVPSSGSKFHFTEEKNQVVLQTTQILQRFLHVSNDKEWADGCVRELNFAKLRYKHFL